MKAWTLVHLCFCYLGVNCTWPLMVNDWFIPASMAVAFDLQVHPKHLDTVNVNKYRLFNSLFALFVIPRCHLLLTLPCKNCHIFWVLATVLSFLHFFFSILQEEYFFLLAHEVPTWLWGEGLHGSSQLWWIIRIAHPHSVSVTKKIFWQLYYNWCSFVCLCSQTDSLVPCLCCCTWEMAKHSQS